MTIKKIRNWETIKNNDGYYNSVMDEINRNYNLSKKIVVEGDINNIFKKILVALHQAYNLNKVFIKDLEFSFSSKNDNNSQITINYKVDFFSFGKCIIIRWKNNDDYYWTEFLFKQKGNKVIIKYSESVLKKNTISGIQGMIDTSWYRVNFRKSYRKWKNMLTLDSNKINKINLKIDNLDKKINECYQDPKFIEANEILKKYMGKKRLDNEQLYKYRNAKNYIEKNTKKIKGIQNKLVDYKNSLFILKDSWIDFVNQNYIE